MDISGIADERSGTRKTMTEYKQNVKIGTRKARDETARESISGGAADKPAICVHVFDGK
jgi:hypothetical protein